MRRTLLQILALFVVVCLPIADCSADETAMDPQAAHAAALEEVRQAYKTIERFRSEYQNADNARRLEINRELKAVVAETRKKVDIMIATALEAFKAAPMTDEKVTQLLIEVVEHQILGRGNNGGDQYESALPIIEALVEGGHDKAHLPIWGAYAAIVTNEFDRAEKLIAIAQERGDFAKAPGESEEEQETLGNAIRYIKDLDRYRNRWQAEQIIQAKEAEADDLPRVKLTTSKGEIVIELFENEAPTATANFVSLVKKGFYDGVVFHRVLPRFMAQGGDPLGKGTGGPGYNIRCECSEPNARAHFRGTLSMAHAGRDTGGSQFFLTFVPTDFLDGRHTAFGRIIQGIEVLGELQRIDPEKPGRATPDKIVSAEVLRDRGHEYSFEKLPER